MEQQPQIEIDETEESPSTFEHSMGRLFEVLDSSPQGRGMYFYRATWDEDDPTRLINITQMSAKATGALKEERFGEFHQAQLQITEGRIGEDDPTRRFIWCEVDPPQRPGKPVAVNARAFHDQYRYEVCNTTNIAKTLIGHAESIDDCIALMASLKGRKGDIGRELAHKVNRFTADFLYRDLGEKFQDITEEADRLFTLINHCQDFGQEVPKWVQGYLVSNLLQVISGKKSPEQRLKPDEAVVVLESAINEGIISTPTSLQRVLGCFELYRYPYGTELLYENLQAKGTNGPKNIFGVERVKFAASYMVTVLREGETGLPISAKNYLNTLQPKNVKERDYQELYEMLDGLVRAVDGNEAADQPTHPRVIGSMFGNVLAKLHGDKRDAAQEEFDQKCVEIVEATLAPLFYKKIGKQALLDETELEEW